MKPTQDMPQGISQLRFGHLQILLRFLEKILALYLVRSASSVLTNESFEPFPLSGLA